MRKLKNVLKLASMLLLPLLSSTTVHSNEIGNHPLGKWPLLSSYIDSDCLDVDDDRLDFIPHAVARKHTITSRFALGSYGGKFFINPEVHKGWKSLSFSIDTARNRVMESGVSCFQVMEIELKAWAKKYEKLYIVVDKAVRYEIPIVILGETN